MGIPSLMKKPLFVVFLFIMGALFLWWLPYFLFGWLPLSEWGCGLIWGDWLSDRLYLVSKGIIPEWNPNYILGVNYIGRDPFNNPLSLGNVFKLFFSDPKMEWIFGLFFYMSILGIGYYRFLRKNDISHPFAMLGAVLITIMPKFMDDIYHGPGKFITAYSTVPWILLTIRNMSTSTPRLKHFLVLGTLGAIAFLGSGAMVSVIISCIIIPYFVYSFWRFDYSKLNDKRRFFLNTSAGILLSCLIAVGLSAYLLLPLFDSLSNTSRSLYSSPVGYGLFDMLGLFFPWAFRLYTIGFYDLPLTIPWIGPAANFRFYFGILLIPVFVFLISDKDLRRKYSFFWVWPVAMIFLFSKIGHVVLPLVPWAERMLNASATENFQFFNIFFCCNIVLMAGLERLREHHRMKAESGSARDYLPPLVKKATTALLAVYAICICIWILTALVLRMHPGFLDEISSLPFFQGERGLIYYYGLQLTMYSYFYDVFFFLFLASFLIRLIILKGFKTGVYFRARYGVVILSILMVADFLLFPKMIYPFTSSLDTRYGKDTEQNAFVVNTVGATERVASNYLSDKISQKVKVFSEFIKQKYKGQPRWDPPSYYRDFKAYNPDKGFFEPLFDPGLSYFPVTVGKQTYNYHESFLPEYFFDFDKALNAGNRKYWRQSWTGVWDPSSPLLDVAGISYLFWYVPLEDDRFELVGRYPVGDGSIYRNKKAVPKAYTVKRLEYFAKRDDLLNRMKDKTFQPLNVATTEDMELRDSFKNMADKKGGASEDSVRIISYEPNRIIIDALARSPSVLVITDMFFPYWMAHVDGKRARIYRVNGVFRGLVVGSGSHRVQMDYRNEPFHRGLKISLATLIILSCLFVFVVYRERRRTR
jgi:hypothetical protein